MLGIGLNRDFIYTVFSLDFKKVSGNDLGFEKKKKIVEKLHGNVKIGSD